MRRPRIARASVATFPAGLLQRLFTSRHWLGTAGGERRDRGHLALVRGRDALDPRILAPLQRPTRRDTDAEWRLLNVPEDDSDTKRRHPRDSCRIRGRFPAPQRSCRRCPSRSATRSSRPSPSTAIRTWRPISGAPGRSSRWTSREGASGSASPSAFRPPDIAPRSPRRWTNASAPWTASKRWRSTSAGRSPPTPSSRDSTR